MNETCNVINLDPVQMVKDTVNSNRDANKHSDTEKEFNELYVVVNGLLKIISDKDHAIDTLTRRLNYAQLTNRNYVAALDGISSVFKNIDDTNIRDKYTTAKKQITDIIKIF